MVHVALDKMQYLLFQACQEWYCTEHRKLKTEPSIAAHACNPDIWNVEAGGLFQASLIYVMSLNLA